MSYNPVTWGHIVGDLSDLSRIPVAPIDLGVTRSGLVSSFPVTNSPVYNPFSKVGEVATAAASVAQLAAFNPYIAGTVAAGFGAKLIYDGIKEFF